jgi:hypothetical protein
MIKASVLAPVLVAAAAMTACGGGGSDAPPPPPPTPTSVTIAGTAAKGAALAGATVDIKCAAGTGAATAGSDGTYTVTITEGALPCALRATGTEGSVFHSVVAGTGSTGTYAANVTPLTEMLVAQLAAAAPAAFFDGFGSSTAVTAEALTQADDYLKLALAGVTDLTGVSPATDALVVGDSHDQKIDATMAGLLAAGMPLDQTVAAIVANPAAPDVVAGPLRPANSECAWFKSGNYRMISPYEADPKWRAHVLSIDAVARTFTDQDGVPGTLGKWDACEYNIADVDASSKVTVSSAGVLVVYTQSTTVATERSPTIGLPEQTLPVSESAGTWNIAGWDPASGSTTPGYVAQTDEMTIDSSGQVTSMSSCFGLLACTVGTGPFPQLVPNTTAGGFDFMESGASIARAFLFKSLSGASVMVFVANDGQFLVGSRKQALGALPAVGTVSGFRQFTLFGDGTMDRLIDDTATVTASDATANTVSQMLTSNRRVDTLSYDKPREGLRYRALSSCTIDGVLNECRQFVQLPLQGMGITLTMSVGTDPTKAFFQTTVATPN